MTDCLGIWLDDLEFVTDGRTVELPDVTEFRGWFDGAESDSPLSPAEIGSFSGREHIGALALSLAGSFEGRSKMALVDMMDRLSAFKTGEHTLRVKDVRRETQRRVTVKRVTLNLDEMAFGVLTYALDMLAADPRRYATVTPFTAGARLFNAGTAPTTPTLRVLGPFSAGMVITEQPTGRTITVGASVNAGQQLTVDPATMTATIDGVPWNILRHVDTPVIPPGETRWYTSNAGTLTGEYGSAWW